MFWLLLVLSVENTCRAKLLYGIRRSCQLTILRITQLINHV